MKADAGVRRRSAAPNGPGGALRLVAPEGAVEGVAARRTTLDLDWAILMGRAQEGDQAAYHRLLREITPYVRSLVVPYHRDPRDVEDTVQDVLLTIHAIRRTYDPARPFAPWLVAISNRRVVDRLRKGGRLRQFETPLAETDPGDPESADPLAPAAQDGHFASFQDGGEEGSDVDAQALRRAVDRLPPGQRQAITLLKLQELSLKEAAQATGQSITALKVATHRALKSLRRILSVDDSR